MSQGHKRTPSNSLADEVVTLLDEILEENKPKKLANGKPVETPAQKEESSNTLQIQDKLIKSVSTPNMLSQKTGDKTTSKTVQPPAKVPARPTTPIGTKSTSVVSPPSKKPTQTNVPNPPPPPPQKAPTTASQNWSQAIGYSLGLTSPKKVVPDDNTAALKKRLRALEDEIRMADAFKTSLQETLGLQVESLRLDLDVEREKNKRLEYELALKSQENITPNTPKISEKISEIPQSEILEKLLRVYEEEKKQLSGLKGSREQNEKLIKQHEEELKNLANRIKEDTIFLINLREQKQQLEKQPHYQYKGSKEEQQLGGRLAVAEAGVRKLNEDMDRERKIIREMESQGVTSVVDKKLESYITLHEEVIKAFKEVFDTNTEATNNLKKQLDEVIKKSEADKEFFETKAKLFEKQFAELNNAKESLDKEKQLIQQRMNEEKENLAQLASQKEAESIRLKAEFENKLKQLEDEVAVLKEASNQVGPLHDKIREIGNKLGEEQSNRLEVEHSLVEAQNKIQSLLAELETAHNIATNETKNHETQRAELNQQLQAVNAEKEALIVKLNELQTKQTKLEKELADKSQEFSEQKTKLEEELKTTSAKVEDEKKQMLETDDKLNVVRDQLAISEGQRRALEELSNKLQNEVKEAGEFYQNKIAELNTQITELSGELTKTKQEKEELEGKLNPYLETMEEIRKALDKLK